jgi:tetratricopeptide (TPR) repeat protein
MRRWVIGLVVGIIVLGIGVGGFYLKGHERVAEGPSPPSEPVAFAFPLLPLPEALGWVGQPGVDADGYPRSSPSALSLVALLRHRQFERLTREMGAFERAAAEDPKKEYWATDAAEAFAVPDPTLTPLLDAWVEREPESAAAHIARGAHRLDLGWHYRGTDVSRQTSAARFEKLEATAALARHDLERAITLNPRALAPHVLLLRNAKMDKTAASEFDRAIAKFPLSFNLYHHRLVSLTPRWGGSHAEVAAFAARGAARATDNPRLRVLAGFADWARAQDKQAKGDHAGALADLSRARTHGEHWVFYRALAASKSAQGDHAGALADLDSALALRPELGEALHARADTAAKLGLLDESVGNFMAALRLDPTSGATELTQYANIAANAAVAHYRAGRPREAIAAFDKALLLDPKHEKVQKARAKLLEHGDPYANEAQVQALIQRARQDDTTEAYRVVDALLTKRGRYAEIIELWSGYIGRHPADGQAYLERGGTHTRLRALDRALADAEKACSLNVPAACKAAQNVRRELTRPNIEARAN